MDKATSTADAILACARVLIVGHGYDGFSYADIADMVGIRKASIHHHFRSKADLVTTLVARYLKEAQEGFGKLLAAIPDPLEQLRAYVGHWVRCIGDRSAPFCLCALLAHELPVLPQDVVLQVRAFFRFLSSWLTSVLERGLAQGSLSFTNAPALEAEVFMATLHGAMLSARAYGNTDMFASVVEPHLRRLSASG